ncbi:MAG: uracil-DNA glycosylase [Candidatus Bathyarchaeota archaeon]|nr:MAG: uracil-DNA glycosylase [Candidatus Bathyarchaeota archaeon]
MKILEEQIQNCNRCGLCHGRRKAVLGEGTIESPLVFVGEAPGRKEDEIGRPFVGSAGRLFDGLLGQVGLGRGDVYITNMVKCRPPKNRRPRSDEINACSQHLDEQLDAIAPAVIAPMGNSATRHFQRKFGLERLRIGEVHGEKFRVSVSWGQAFLFPLYHPAAVLYNRTLELELRRDLESMMALVR